MCRSLMQRLTNREFPIGRRIRELLKRPGTKRRPSHFTPCAERLEDRTLLAVLTINSLADNTFVDDELTLREAVGLVSGDFILEQFTSQELAQIDFAEPLGTNDTIRFEAGLAGGTIDLTGGALLVSNDVAIIGLGRDLLTIDAGGRSQIFFTFNLFENVSVLISDITLTGGNAGSFASGGAINNSELLTVVNTNIIGNIADGFGGGIMNGSSGRLTMINSLVQDNIAFGGGGGIENFRGVLHVTGSTIAGNTAAFSFGGGIENDGGIATIEGGTVISSNIALDGGGIENLRGMLTVTDSEISRNTANRFGGGVDNFRGTTNLHGNVILSSNTALDGGGIENFEGFLTVGDILISQNTATRFGGGIDNFLGRVTVQQGTTISQNTALLDGGGIENFQGRLSITEALITQNTATRFGGGIDHFDGTATIQNATISGNTADFGGGLSSFDRLSIFGSTLDHNVARFDGGGLLLLGLTDVVNSTISQNTANDDGGGIMVFDNLTLFNSVTIFANRADADGAGGGTGGGIWTFADNRTFTVLFNSIVAGNLQGTAPNDIANKNVEPNSTNNLIGDPGSAGGLLHGTVPIGGGNQVSNIVGDGQGNLLNVAGVLDPVLRFNGGSTQTHALVRNMSNVAINAGRIPVQPSLPASPVIPKDFRTPQDSDRLDRNGNPVQIPPGNPAFQLPIVTPASDQRGGGFLRITGGQIDIGAFESQVHVDLAFGSAGGTQAQIALFDSEALDPDNPQPLEILRPFGMFGGGVRVALGDVNGDGFNDIIAGAGPGGGPHVRVFDGASFEPLTNLPGSLESFFAYAVEFGGGVYVAAGDLDGDGFADIITGAGEGGGPHVRAWSGRTGAPLFNFFAYDPQFRGGVRVAAGLITGDENADLITGAGPGGGPHVRVFDGTRPDLAAAGVHIPGPLGSFYAYEPGYTGGVFVAGNSTQRLTGPSIVTGSGQRIGGATVAMFFADGRRVPFQTPTFAGVTVATFDFDRNGISDFVTSTAGPFASGQAIVFSGGNVPPFGNNNLPFNPTLLDELFPFRSNHLGGIFVAASTTDHDLLLEAFDNQVAQTGGTLQIDLDDLDETFTLFADSDWE